MAVKAKIETLGSVSPLLHICQDEALQVLLGRLQSFFLALCLFQAPSRQHRLEALRALAGLRGVSLVHDHGEALAWQLADLAFAITGNFWRVVTMIVLPVSRASLSWREVVSMFSTTPSGLLELPHRALELPVEDPAVGDDDDGVEDPPVQDVVKRRELVREPGDGVALAAPGGMLNQVPLARPAMKRVASPGAARQSSWWYRGKISEALPGLPAPVVLLLDLWMNCRIRSSTLSRAQVRFHRYAVA